MDVGKKRCFSQKLLMEKSSKQVVLVPFPAQGHLLPIVYLAKKLAAHGFAVTIINIDSIHETVKQGWRHAGIQLESIPMELKVPKGFNADSLDSVGAFIDAVNDLEEPLADLLGKLSDAQAISCVISDFYHVSAPFAAARHGIPSVCFWSGMAAWASIQYSHSLLLDAGFVPVDDSNSNELVSILPGLSPLKATDLPFYYRKDLYFRRGAGKCLALATKRHRVDKWILVNSFYELEPNVFDAMQNIVPGKFVPIGPLFPLKGAHASELEPSLRPENRESLAWLDGHSPKSVLYVSFGSVAALTPEELEELTRGIEDSGHPFLMVASQQLVPNLNEDFFDKFRERTTTTGTGLVVSWAPQLAVLHHEAIGGFLTHCGWNSTLESLSNGVPMLGWPRDSDQNTNCNLIVEARGIGLELQDKNRSGICHAIGRLMTNGDMRQQSLEIENDAKNAASELGASHKNLKQFLNSLCA